MHPRKWLYVLSSSFGFRRSRPGASRARAQSPPGHRRGEEVLWLEGGAGDSQTGVAGVVCPSGCWQNTGHSGTMGDWPAAFTIPELWAVAASFPRGTRGHWRPGFEFWSPHCSLQELAQMPLPCL